ncbi:MULTISPECIES: transglutaminase-like cysteine peptidase [Vreelandella]|uniref:Twin-arginine translocation signal domain-containing protein n=2 Tax=Vreelandella TaxID=3137766 RepID=A0A7C9NPS2_9GAMM|nr:MULTISPECIES: transglutaminase-like cysteine peptidase [Halomonas]NDL70468.1 twin-arginine translocation signal domain-containing protein [Halomonas alkaliphila]NYS43324.1 transglutaminase-like cysteine peptidase [Halomonas zhaodongensis]
MPASSRYQCQPLTRRQFLATVGAVALGAGLGIHPAPAAAFNPQRLRQSMQQQYGQSGLAVLEEWFAMLERLRGQDIQTQLRDVNDFVNRRIRWVDDIHVWGQEDFWATPLESLGKGQGDCEDYSIAKYVSLKQLGVPGERLRMIYVRARIGRSQISQAHMVLGYYSTPSGEPLILDNIAPSISPASQRTDLDPLFSFNSEGLWAGGGTESRADPLARLSRWRNVIERMQSQGFI